MSEEGLHTHTPVRNIYRIYETFGAPIANLMRLIPTLEADERASIIKLCQAQHVPHSTESSSLRTLVSNLYLHEFYIPRDRMGFRLELVPLLDILESLITKSPFWSGLIIMLARSLPLKQHDELSLKAKGWIKEINCCEGKRPEDKVDFDVMFDPRRHHETMHPTLPANPYMMKYFYNKLVRWRRWVSQTSHYPRANNKAMSYETRREYEEYSGESWIGEFSQRDYLHVAAIHGLRLGGAVEMRQRWYRSGFKPRTYYAQGGVYGDTMCLQNMFSELVNITPITHHVTRLLPSRLTCGFDQYFRMYDLTSFTSLCWSQFDFLDSLARFCSGFECQVITPDEGPVIKDLGTLLSEYNWKTNRSCEVVFTRCPFIVDPLGVSNQNVAGMLGVFGNLMSCTFAHGVIISTHVENEDQINVAGDDGVVPEDEETEVAIREAINLIGIHETTKEFITTQPGCIHLKRPIRQFGQALRGGFMIIFVDISLVLEMIAGVKDTRYTRPEELSPDQRVSLVGREVLRFLRSVYRCQEILNDEYTEAIRFLLRLEHVVEEVMNVSLHGGRLTQCGDEIFWPWIPEEIDDFLKDPWIQTVHHRYSGQVIANRTEKLIDTYDPETLAPGMEFEANSDQYLKFLFNCRLIDEVMVKTVLIGEEGLEYLLRIADRSWEDPLVYKYTVIHDVPDVLRYL